MIFNKRHVQKVNCKKILHKIGKFWVVVSVALLSAIGAKSVAARISAKANTNLNNNNQANHQITNLGSHDSTRLVRNNGTRLTSLNPTKNAGQQSSPMSSSDSLSRQTSTLNSSSSFSQSASHVNNLDLKVNSLSKSLISAEAIHSQSRLSGNFKNQLLHESQNLYQKIIEGQGSSQTSSAPFNVDKLDRKARASSTGSSLNQAEFSNDSLINNDINNTSSFNSSSVSESTMAEQPEMMEEDAPEVGTSMGSSNEKGSLLNINNLMNIMHNNIQSGSDQSQNQAAYQDLLDMLKPSALQEDNSKPETALSGTAYGNSINDWVSQFNRVADDLNKLDGDAPMVKSLVNLKSQLSDVSSDLSVYSMVHPAMNLSFLGDRLTNSGFVHNSLLAKIKSGFGVTSTQAEKYLENMGTIAYTMNKVINMPSLSSSYSQVVNDLSNLPSQNSNQQAATLHDISAHVKDIKSNLGSVPGVNSDNLTKLSDGLDNLSQGAESVSQNTIINNDLDTLPVGSLYNDVINYVTNHNDYDKFDSIANDAKNDFGEASNASDFINEFTDQLSGLKNAEVPTISDDLKAHKSDSAISDAYQLARTNGTATNRILNNLAGLNSANASDELNVIHDQISNNGLFTPINALNSIAASAAAEATSVSNSQAVNTAMDSYVSHAAGANTEEASDIIRNTVNNLTNSASQSTFNDQLNAINSDLATSDSANEADFKTQLSDFITAAKRTSTPMLGAIHVDDDGAVRDIYDYIEDPSRSALKSALISTVIPKLHDVASQTLDANGENNAVKADLTDIYTDLEARDIPALSPFLTTLHEDAGTYAQTPAGVNKIGEMLPAILNRLTNPSFDNIDFDKVIGAVKPRLASNATLSDLWDNIQSNSGVQQFLSRNGLTTQEVRGVMSNTSDPTYKALNHAYGLTRTDPNLDQILTHVQEIADNKLNVNGKNDRVATALNEIAGIINTDDQIRSLNGASNILDQVQGHVNDYASANVSAIAAFMPAVINRLTSNNFDATDFNHAIDVVKDNLSTNDTLDGLWNNIKGNASIQHFLTLHGATTENVTQLLSSNNPNYADLNLAYRQVRGDGQLRTILTDVQNVAKHQDLRSNLGAINKLIHDDHNINEIPGMDTMTSDINAERATLRVAHDSAINRHRSARRTHKIHHDSAIAKHDAAVRNHDRSLKNSAAAKASTAESSAAAADSRAESGIKAIVSKAAADGINPESAAQSITPSDITKMSSSDEVSNVENTVFNQLSASATNSDRHQISDRVNDAVSPSFVSDAVEKLVNEPEAKQDAFEGLANNASNYLRDDNNAGSFIDHFVNDANFKQFTGADAGVIKTIFNVLRANPISRNITDQYYRDAQSARNDLDKILNGFVNIAQNPYSDGETTVKSTLGNLSSIINGDNTLKQIPGFNNIATGLMDAKAGYIPASRPATPVRSDVSWIAAMMPAILNHITSNKFDHHDFYEAIESVKANLGNTAINDLSTLWDHVKGTSGVEAFVGRHGDLTNQITDMLHSDNPMTEALNAAYHQTHMDHNGVSRILNDLENINGQSLDANGRNRAIQNDLTNISSTIGSDMTLSSVAGMSAIASNARNEAKGYAPITLPIAPGLVDSILNRLTNPSFDKTDFNSIITNSGTGIEDVLKSHNNLDDFLRTVQNNSGLNSFLSRHGLVTSQVIGVLENGLGDRANLEAAYQVAHNDFDNVDRILNDLNNIAHSPLNSHGKNDQIDTDLDDIVSAIQHDPKLNAINGLQTVMDVAKHDDHNYQEEDTPHYADEQFNQLLSGLIDGYNMQKLADHLASSNFINSPERASFNRILNDLETLPNNTDANGDLSDISNQLNSFHGPLSSVMAGKIQSLIGQIEAHDSTPDALATYADQLGGYSGDLINDLNKGFQDVKHGNRNADYNAVLDTIMDLDSNPKHEDRDLKQIANIINNGNGNLDQIPVLRDVAYQARHVANLESSARMRRKQANQAKHRQHQRSWAQEKRAAQQRHDALMRARQKQQLDNAHKRALARKHQRDMDARRQAKAKAKADQDARIHQQAERAHAAKVARIRRQQREDNARRQALARKHRQDVIDHQNARAKSVADRKARARQQRQDQARRQAMINHHHQDIIKRERAAAQASADKTARARQQAKQKAAMTRAKQKRAAELARLQRQQRQDQARRQAMINQHHQDVIKREHAAAQASANNAAHARERAKQASISNAQKSQSASLSNSISASNSASLSAEIASANAAENAKANAEAASLSNSVKAASASIAAAESTEQSFAQSLLNSIAMNSNRSASPSSNSVAPSSADSTLLSAEEAEIKRDQALISTDNNEAMRNLTDPKVRGDSQVANRASYDRNLMAQLSSGVNADALSPNSMTAENANKAAVLAASVAGDTYDLLSKANASAASATRATAHSATNSIKSAPSSSAKRSADHQNIRPSHQAQPSQSPSELPSRESSSVASGTSEPNYPEHSQVSGNSQLNRSLSPEADTDQNRNGSRLPQTNEPASNDKIAASILMLSSLMTALGAAIDRRRHLN